MIDIGPISGTVWFFLPSLYWISIWIGFYLRQDSIWINTVFGSFSGTIRVHVRINGEVFLLTSLLGSTPCAACSTSLARSTGHSAISDDKVVGIISSSKKVLIRHHSLVPPMNFRPTNDVIQPTMLDYMYVEFNSPILLFGAWVSLFSSFGGKHSNYHVANRLLQMYQIIVMEC